MHRSFNNLSILESLDSFLKIGMTLIDFRIEGKTLSEKEKLNSSDDWFEISLLSNFKIFVGILLEPTALRRLRDKIIFWISILSTGFMKKELMSVSGRKLWNLFIENLIVDWIVLEMFMKCLLNALAMSSGLLNVVLFSITAEDTEFEVLLRYVSFLIRWRVFFKSLIFVWK